jgi:hypothetical protein
MLDYVTAGVRYERTPYGKERRFYPSARADVPYWENEPVDEPLTPCRSPLAASPPV